MTSKRLRTIVGFAVIAVIAAFLRLWRISWGLGEALFIPDEMIWGWRGAHFLPLEWRSFFAVNLDQVPYPAFYGYVAGLATAMAHAVGLTAEPPELFFDILLISRVVSAGAGVLTVVVIGILGARLCSRRVGLMAAALMAVVPLEVNQVYYASVDVLQTTLMTIGVLASYGLARSGTMPRAALAGLVAGLASATKYPGVFALMPVAMAIFESPRRGGASWRSLAPCALLGFAVAFAGACPPCLLRAVPMLSTIHEARLSMWNAPNNTLVPSLGWYGRPYLYELVASLPFSLGWPLYGASLAGIWAAVRRRDLLDRILFAAMGPYFLLIGASHITFPRYLLPLFPPLVLLTSRAFLGRPGRHRAGLAILAVVWIYTFALTTSQVAAISYEPQEEVARWISTHLRTDGTETRVAYPRKLAGYYVQLDPFLRERRLTPVRAVTGRWLAGQPDVFVLPDWADAWVRRDAPDPAISSELRGLTSGSAGYREAARFRSWYLQRDWYEWIDPGLLPLVGSYGFTVYVRSEESPGSEGGDRGSPQSR